MTNQPERSRRHKLPPPLPAFDQLVERRIRDAQHNGVFDDLPGAGAPLALDDDALVPEELRAAYRLLKNSGFVPAEVEALRELHEVECALAQTQNESQRSVLLGKLNLLLARAGMARSGNLRLEQDYFLRVAEKLATRRSS